MFARIALRRLSPSCRILAQPSSKILPSIITSVPTPSPVRSFHSTSPSLAKKSKNKKNQPIEEEEEEVTEDIPVTIDFDAVTSKFEKTLEKFSKSATELKLGKANPKIFDNLPVETADGEVPFNTIAQTSVKGRHFVITLFDPANGKHVINAILASDLNMSGQIDPANKFAIKVPLPSLTTETKKESAKALKEVFEKYKHGKGLDSLASVRTHFRHKFTKHLKKQKLSDAENKLLKELEDLHKKYGDKLADAFKSAETAILK